VRFAQGEAPRPEVPDRRPALHVQRERGEVDHQDLWQRSTIAVAATGAEGFHVRKVMQQVERYVEAWGGVEVIEAELTLHHPDA